MRGLPFVLVLLLASPAPAQDCIPYQYGLHEVATVALPAPGLGMVGAQEHLYVGSEDGILIYRADPVGLPVELGRLLPGERVDRIYLFPERLCALQVSGYGPGGQATVFDIGDPAAPRLLSAGTIAGWPAGIHADRLWTTERDSEMRFELREYGCGPGASIQLRTADAWIGYGFLALRYPLLYVGEWHGEIDYSYQRIEAFDLTDPTHPVAQGAQLESDLLIYRFWPLGDKCIIEHGNWYGTSYAAGDLVDGLQLENAIYGRCDHLTNAASLVGERALLRGRQPYFGKEPLEVFDFEERVIGRYSVSGHNPGSVVFGQRWYALAADGMLILDIADPRTPQPFDGYGYDSDYIPQAGSLALRGDLACAAADQVILTYDLSNPSDIRRLGGVALPGGGEAQTPIVVADFAYFARPEAQVILPVSLVDPRHPALLPASACSAPTRRMAASGDWLYAAAGEAGVLIFAGATSGQLQEHRRLAVPGDVRDLGVLGEFLLVVTDALEVFSLAAPGQPTPLTGLPLAGQAERIAIGEGFACVALGDAGLATVNLAEPASPQLWGRLEQAVTSIAIDGSLAYGLGDGLLVIDLADPVKPTLLARMDDLGGFTDVQPTEHFLVVTSRPGAADDPFLMTYPKQCLDCASFALRRFDCKDAPAVVALDWELTGEDLGALEQRLTAVDAQGRLHAPAIQKLGLGHFAAEDRDPALALGGGMTYTLSARAPGQAWTLVEQRTVKQPIAATHVLDPWPNPFNPTITLRVLQAESAAVRVRVFDVAGRLVRALHEGPLLAGQHDLRWDGRDGAGEPAASGIYFLRYESDARTESRKVVLLR